MEYRKVVTGSIVFTSHMSSIEERLKARYPRVWAFMAARFARGEYLGLHLTIGLAISVVGLWVFAAVTEDVIHHESLTQFDMTVLNWLHTHSSPTGHTIFQAISALGSGVTLSVIALLVGIALAIRRQGLLLAGWFTAFVGAGILNGVLKAVFHRPRPIGATLTSWSFPSGHAMASLIGYGMLVYLFLILGSHGRRTQIAVVGCAALLVIAIGLSRLYLGVHYFSDVVGGFGAGMLWLSACISGLEVSRRWHPAVPTGGSGHE